MTYNVFWSVVLSVHSEGEPAFSLVRWSAGAGQRQSEAFPSGRHHEPDPQETHGLRQEAAGTPPVLDLRPDGDP